MVNGAAFGLAGALAGAFGILLTASKLSHTASESTVDADGWNGRAPPPPPLLLQDAHPSQTYNTGGHSSAGLPVRNQALATAMASASNRTSTRPRSQRRMRQQRSEAGGASEVVEVCFLALGPAVQMDRSAPVIRNIDAHSQRPKTVRYHLLVDQPTAVLRARMRLFGATWRGIAKRRVHLHSVGDAPPVAQSLYKQLSRTATGPGPIYLYKPLLHLVLPSWLTKLIVLDTDLFVTADIAGLWGEFARFSSTALLGLAVEQCPSYQQVRALGGFGLNGGVQLLHLSRMRASARYAEVLAAYTSTPMRYPMKEGGIGWLGDQTLYSWMSVNASGGRSVFHLLPCGWNRQTGTHMAGWPHFWRDHQCDAPCNLIHGNFVGHKRFMESLKADPGGASCKRVVAQYKRSDRAFRPGSADARMLDVIDRTCCPAGLRL
jgi:hypothetical protein